MDIVLFLNLSRKKIIINPLPNDKIPKPKNGRRAI